ncbi:MAG: hypothetical protein NXI04_06855 [Planctomycetaceae bacterium]|nr:hypothetical protein [Planctomycetaceae bacterium]
MRSVENLIRSALENSLLRQTYRGTDGNGHFILGYGQRMASEVIGPQVFSQIQIRCLKDLALIVIRQSVVPGGNQWRGSFKDESAFSGRLFKLPKEIVEFESAVKSSVARLTEVDQDELQVTAKDAWEIIRSADADSLLSGTPTRILQELESQLTDDQIEFSRKMRRSALLSFPKMSDSEEELELQSYKIATHQLASWLMSQRSTEPDPYKNFSLAIAIQILASRVFDRHLWESV